MYDRRIAYFDSLPDRELVGLLLANDQEAVEYVFFHRCNGMFAHIIHSVFQSQGKKEELITEFYLYLCENEWNRLRKFEFKSLCLKEYKTMKRLIMTALACVTALTLSAQIDTDWSKRVRESQQNAREEYEKFRQQATKEYDDFRKRANEEYARFMADPWTAFEAQPAEEIPKLPKPPTPVLVDPTTHPEDKTCRMALKPPKPLWSTS